MVVRNKNNVAFFSYFRWSSKPKGLTCNLDRMTARIRGAQYMKRPIRWHRKRLELCLLLPGHRLVSRSSMVWACTIISNVCLDLSGILTVYHKQYYCLGKEIDDRPRQPHLTFPVALGMTIPTRIVK